MSLVSFAKRIALTVLTVASVTAYSPIAASQVGPTLDDFMSPDYDCDLKHEGTDYRRNDPDAVKLKRMVEGAHFTQSVQRGVAGNTGVIEGDLDYTLNKFPNHPRALLIAAKNQMRPDYKPYNPLRRDRFWPKKECYFQRALKFAQDDPMVHLVIAIFYHQYERYELAVRHYKASLEYDPNNAEAHYNYGLLLVKIDQPKASLVHAKKAYSMGYPLPGLKNLLAEAGVWAE